MPNIAATSAAYAQVTGLLAGFAFTALVVLLTPTQVERRPRNRQQTGYLLTALFSAFVALLMTTMAYCLLAGEDVTAARGRTVTQELVDGLPFGLAFISLFHGLTLLLHVGQAPASVVRTVHTITVSVLPVMAFFYLVSAVPDTEATRAALNGGCPDERIYLLGLILNAACSVFLVLSMIGKAHWRRLRMWVPKRPANPSIMALVVSMLSATFASTLTGRSTDYLMSRAWLVVYLVAAAFLHAAIGFLLICAGPGHFAARVVGVAPVRPAPLTVVPNGFWFDSEPRRPRRTVRQGAVARPGSRRRISADRRAP